MSATSLSDPGLPIPQAALSLLSALQTLITESKLGIPVIDAISPTARALLASSAALALLLRFISRKRNVRQAKENAKGGSGEYVDAAVLGDSLSEAQVKGGPGEREWEYDVIVVGGGTSGCALAARLSEDENLKVLLLEAGGRAHYGAPGDFDQWATHVGDDSWSWKNFQHYFRKFERFNPHPEYPLVDIATKGTQGPVNVGYFNTVTPPSKAFIQACVRVGIPFTPDFNGPNGTMGVSRIMTYVDSKFHRVSSETAYLTSDVLKRKNLTVATNATATRILFDTTTLGSSSRPRAVGVEFTTGPSGRRYKATVRKEVILSGGAVHTPHLLKLSGIGPREELQKHGIHVVKHNPHVGAHLVDHPVIDVYFKDKHNKSPNFLKPKNFRQFIRLLQEVRKYRARQPGTALAMNFGESAAFIRSDDPMLFPPEEFPQKIVDSASAEDSPDLELFSTPFAYKEHGLVGFDVHTFALHCYLLRPTSSGHVLLKSSNPFDLPSVNPNYLSTPEDLEKLVRGVRILLKIAQTEPLASHLEATFTRPDLDHRTHLLSHKEIEDLVKERVETVYHPATTCKMGTHDGEDEKGGVVDYKLRVFGVDGLRVCDASIFPYIISGHTAGGCFAIAEKLADEIKAEHHLK
ncbi:hypothetical protein H1R20_g14544, partial [Candolleomyces eurysporus]